MAGMTLTSDLQPALPSDPDLKTDGFGLDTCRSMVAVMDVSFGVGLEEASGEEGVSESVLRAATVGLSYLRVQDTYMTTSSPAAAAGTSPRLVGTTFTEPF